ncbi:MAG: type II secretion system F family protein [Gemmatimonadaceae bacterium]
MKVLSTGIRAVLRSFDDGRDRSEFYRGWRAGISAGLTHPHILSQLGASRGATAEIRQYLLEGTTAGRGISELVRRRPVLFEPFEAALLVLGDEGGQLDGVLRELADFFFRQYRMMLVVKRRLAYPLFVSLVTIVLGPLPLLFMGQSRAYVAALVVGLLAWGAFGGALLAGRAQAYQRRPQFVRARLARALALTVGAGLPLGRAALLSAGAAGPEMAAHVRRFDERALTSQPLSVTFAGAPDLTPEFMSTLQVAERTGDHATTLGRLAALYEDGFR